LNASPCEIKVKNVTIKEIFMEEVKNKYGDTTSKRYNVFPLPLKNLKINNGTVKSENVSIFFHRDKINHGYPNIYSVYKKAKQKEFFGDTLIFGEDVERGIIEYQEKIKKAAEELKKKFMLEELKSLDNKVRAMPQVLYSYLETLHDVSLNPDFYQSSTSTNYCCTPWCSLIHECKSIISLMGVNCIDENKRQMQNTLVEQARKFDDGSGNKDVFTLHLRPFSIKCSHDKWSLTLRIYFKVKDNKIIIGWIGQHPYLPCPPDESPSACSRIDCPNNPAYVPGV
jgi:predicted AlkP superfamily pyrophosphatase or phosphodiesterase